MTIIDGVIGDVLSTRASGERFSQGFNPEVIGYSREEFDNLPNNAQHNLIQNWVFDVEIQMEFDHNPVSRLRAQEEHRLGVTRFSVHHLQYPTIPPDVDIEERITLFRNVLLFGSRVVIHSDVYGDIEGEAWIPNFSAGSFSPHGLIEDIAGLIALDNLRRKMGRSA